MKKKIINPIDIHVGLRLKRARRDKEISQTKLGKITGVTFQQMQKYETAVNRVSASRLYEFSTVLGVPIQYFFEGFECDIAEYQTEEVDRMVIRVVRAFKNYQNH